MKINIKKWMLAYAIIFFFMSLFFMQDDIENHYKRAYIAWSLFIYLLATCGNVMYAMDFFDKLIGSYWKIISPLIILQFIISGIVDMQFSKNAGSVNIYQNILIWLVGIAVFSPTFRANFIIGYGKKEASINPISDKERKRPVLVWVIFIFYLFSIMLTCFLFYLIFSGKIPIPQEQRHYLDSLTKFDYVFTIVSLLINLIGAVLLFLLRKTAFYFFAAGITLSTLMTIWSALTRGWPQALSGAGFIGSIVGYAIAIAICIYAWNLKKEKVLK